MDQGVLLPLPSLPPVTTVSSFARVPPTPTVPARPPDRFATACIDSRAVLPTEKPADRASDNGSRQQRNIYNTSTPTDPASVGVQALNGPRKQKEPRRASRKTRAKSDSCARRRSMFCEGNGEGESSWACEGINCPVRSVLVRRSQVKSVRVVWSWVQFRLS